jgi:prepilin-type processing-associated H-X9-DG protein
MLNETSGEQRVRSARLAGFTVAELVAVVAVIAMCIVILLPAVGHAREGSRTVSCQTTLFGFGQAMQIYANDNQDGIPGINTSGLAVEAKKFLWGSNPSVLSPRSLPVQNWDWMTPLLQDDPNLPDGRAARFHYLYSEYRCPEQNFQASLYVAGTPPDLVDFQQYTWPACSYLMPGFFQFFGQNMAGHVVAYSNLPSGGVVPIYAHVPSANWEVRVDDYSPRLDRVGPAARKVFVADGIRYFDAAGFVDIDVSVLSNYYGAFGSGGAWRSGDSSYGVAVGSQNWCGQIVNLGSPAGGRNLPLSYRHSLAVSDIGTSPAGGVTSGGTHWGGVDLGGGDLQPIANGSAQYNRGYMNTVFFDGHVERLNDRASREIDLWYPTGAIVQTPAEGMTCASQDMVIP